MDVSLSELWELVLDRVHPAVSVAWLTVPTMDKLAVLCKMLALSLKEKNFLFGSKGVTRVWAFLFSGNAVLFR